MSAALLIGGFVRRVLASVCPVCNRSNNAVTATDGTDKGPVAGDLSVCFGCGSFLKFDIDLTQREMTLEEIGQLLDSERINLQRARAFVVRNRREKDL